MPVTGRIFSSGNFYKDKPHWHNVAKTVKNGQGRTKSLNCGRIDNYAQTISLRI